MNFAAALRRFDPINIGILTTFALIPLWYRFPGSPRSFSALYSTGFLIFWPMLWTVSWWLMRGLPGLGALRRNPARRWWALLLLTLVLWATLSSSWAYTRAFRPVITMSAVLPFGLAVLFAVVVSCVPLARRQIATALIIGLIWNTVLVFLQTANQGAIGLRFLGEFRFSVEGDGSILQAAEQVFLRPFGLMPHPNMLAGFMALSLLAALSWIASKNPWRWFAGTIAFLSGLFAFLLTFSRAAWGGFAIGALTVIVLAVTARVRTQVGRSGAYARALRDLLRFERLATLFLAFITLALFALLFRSFLLARVGVNGESVELRSIADRAVYTQYALRSINETPVLGVGLGNFPWRASYYLMTSDYDLRGDNVHNIYLSAFAELGGVGLLLMLMAMACGAWAVLRTVIRPKMNETDGDASARFALFAGFVALAAIGMLDHYPWTLIQFQAAFWGLLAAAGGSSSTSGNELHIPAA